VRVLPRCAGSVVAGSCGGVAHGAGLQPCHRVLGRLAARMSWWVYDKHTLRQGVFVVFASLFFCLFLFCSAVFCCILLLLFFFV
jgi:hypothetical protein